VLATAGPGWPGSGGRVIATLKVLGLRACDLGSGRRRLETDRPQLTNVHTKPAGRAVDMPYRTPHRFAVERGGVAPNLDRAGRRRQAGGRAPARLPPSFPFPGAQFPLPGCDGGLAASGPATAARRTP
jgi:hypothetical protein